jgi:hypothetical protein
MYFKYSSVIPIEWKQRPYTTYETEFLYTGFGRINILKKEYQQMTHIQNGVLELFVQPYIEGSIHKVYHTELARIHQYSETEWVEFVQDTVHTFTPTEKE